MTNDQWPLYQIVLLGKNFIVSKSDLVVIIQIVYLIGKVLSIKPYSINPIAIGPIAINTGILLQLYYIVLHGIDGK